MSNRGRTGLSAQPNAPALAGGRRAHWDSIHPSTQSLGAPQPEQRQAQRGTPPARQLQIPGARLEQWRSAPNDLARNPAARGRGAERAGTPPTLNPKPRAHPT
ncbi:hypothetical protein GCM10009827_020970 [Dactylosporangium maewongense]|uniref:Uncharacterized protein n=1 Tax=Dactylosporangium maewongense TaxID=634393 RepID=A0ABP4KQ18_9ACTN